MGWHDGYAADFAALDALSPTDRLTAETELCDALRTNSAGPCVAMGLGHLRSTAALPLLHTNLTRFGLYALQAIASINPAAPNSDKVLAMLRSCRLTEYQLFDIIMGLGVYFRLEQLDPRLPVQLLALLTHRESLVRYHALNAIRRLYNLPDLKAGNGHITTQANVLSDTVFCLITSDNDPANFRKAQQILQAQLAALPNATAKG